MTITDADVERSEQGYEVVGPAYFAARRIAERVWQGSDTEPFKDVAKKAAELVREELYDYIESHIQSDLEVNFQGHLYRLVDDTVQALLTGTAWAMERYPLSKRYVATEVRAAVAKHGGEPLLMARIADLEAEVDRLKADIAREREYRRY